MIRQWLRSFSLAPGRCQESRRRRYLLVCRTPTRDGSAAVTNRREPMPFSGRSASDLASSVVEEPGFAAVPHPAREVLGVSYRPALHNLTTLNVSVAEPHLSKAARLVVSMLPALAQHWPEAETILEREMRPHEGRGEVTSNRFRG